MARTERSILIIGGALLALVIVAVTLVLAIGPSEPKDFPEGSPEATLQRYLRSLAEGDEETAMSLLSEDVRRALSPSGIPRFELSRPDLEDARITIDRVEEHGDRATLHLTIERFSGSGIDFDRYSYEQHLSMVREDGAWKIDQPFFGF